MQNIPSELIITVKNYFNITSFKMKGSPDLGQAVILVETKIQCSPAIVLYISLVIYETQREFTLIDCFPFLWNPS